MVDSGLDMWEDSPKSKPYGLSSKRTIFASNWFKLLQIILESVSGRCANENVGPKAEESLPLVDTFWDGRLRAGVKDSLEGKTAA